MRLSKLRVAAVIVVLVAGAVCAYYLIARHVYFAAAKSAFRRLPIDNCYFIPWPAGPKLIGQLEPDDPIYLRREFVGENSQGMHLTIYDSNGMFEIETEK